MSAFTKKIVATASILLTLATIPGCGKSWMRTSRALYPSQVPGYQATKGVGYCDGANVGLFDVYMKLSDARADMYEFYIVPVYFVAAYARSGFIAQVNLFNSDPTSRPLVSAVRLLPGKAEFLGYVTVNEFNYFSEMAITPADASAPFLSQTTDQFVRCALPAPGDGIDYQNQIVGARTDPPEGFDTADSGGQVQ